MVDMIQRKINQANTKTVGNQVNERREYMQETQHTQQTSTQAAQKT